MQVSKRKTEALENELNLQNNKITFLENVNSNLDTLIHKDNKLIPAMEFAVKELITSYDPDKAQQLLDELTNISNDRKGILTNHTQTNIPIANLKNIRVNSIVNYMHKKAIEHDIDYKFVCIGDIQTIIPNLISEDEFCTLIADITENALIATKTSINKHVLLLLEMLPNKPVISVYDSGNNFSKEVIKHLGKRRYTTHKDSGGTGIGLMNTFKLLKEYNASFSIEENIDNPSYTKIVSIIFDKNGTKTYNGLIIK